MWVGFATASRALVRLLFGSRSVLFCKLWGQERPVRTFIGGHELTIRRVSIHVGVATGSRALVCLSVSLDYLGLFPELFLLSLNLVKFWGRERHPSELSSAAMNCRKDKSRLMCGSLRVRELLYACRFLSITCDLPLSFSCSTWISSSIEVGRDLPELSSEAMNWRYDERRFMLGSLRVRELLFACFLDPVLFSFASFEDRNDLSELSSGAMNWR